MSWFILVIALFLNPGEPPQSYAVTLAPGVECGDEIAAAYVNHITNGQGGYFNYSCDRAEGPDAPAEKPKAPKLNPGDNEAALHT